MLFESSVPLDIDIIGKQRYWYNSSLLYVDLHNCTCVCFPFEGFGFPLGQMTTAQLSPHSGLCAQGGSRVGASHAFFGFTPQSKHPLQKVSIHSPKLGFISHVNTLFPKGIHFLK